MYSNSIEKNSLDLCLNIIINLYWHEKLFYVNDPLDMSNVKSELRNIKKETLLVIII